MNASQRSAAAVAGFVLLLAALGYAWTGSPALAFVRTAGSADTLQPDAMVQRLAARLAQSPDDAQGWAMLGRSYLALQRMDEAVAAWRHAAALRPGDADVLADLADALAATQGHRLEGEPTQWLERAVAADPAHVKARVLLGLAAERRGDMVLAARHWQGALDAGAPDHPLLEQAREGLLRARPGAGEAAPAVQGRIEIAAALRLQTRPDEGRSAPVRRGARDVAVVIDRARP